MDFHCPLAFSVRFRPPPPLPERDSDHETYSSPSESGRHADLEPPPRGAEEGDEEAFFSMSEGSDEGQQPRSRREKSLRAAASSVARGFRVRSIA